MVFISKEGPPLCCTVLFINRDLLGRNVSMSCHRMFNLVMSCHRMFNLVMSCHRMFNLVMSCHRMFDLVMSCHRMFNLVMIFVAVLVWLTEHSVVLWIYVSNPSIFLFKKLKFYVLQIMWDFRLYVTCNGNFFKQVTPPWSSKKEKTNHDLFLTILLLLLKLKLLVLLL